MMLCILIWTIALIIGGVATSFALIIICRILLGIGEGFYYPLQSVFIKTGFRSRSVAGQTQRGSSASRSRPPLRCLFSPVDRHPRLAFQLLLCAALGLIPLWLLWRYVADKPEQHKSISEQELAYIKAGQERKAQAAAKVLCCG